jgi:hypothetical protein
VVKPFNVKDWPVWVYGDPGLDHPFAILWFTIGPAGTVYVIDEVHEGGMTVKVAAGEIKKRLPGRNIRKMYLDPRQAFAKVYGLQDGKTIAEQFADEDLHFDPYPRTAGPAALANVNQVKTALQEGKLKIFNTCKMTIWEIENWKWKRNLSGEAPSGDDAFVDRDNDAIDTIRGFYASGHRFAPPTLTVATPREVPSGRAPRRGQEEF